jgi:hypothetical protein
MDNQKETEFSSIVGKTVENFGQDGYQDVWIKFTDGSKLFIITTDDNCGCNDRWAEFGSIADLNLVMFRTVTSVEDKEIEPDHARFTIRCGDVSATFDLIHTQNGFYGYSWNFTLTT